MKRVLFAAAVLGVAVCGLAGTPPAENKTSSGFDKMKSLVGVWKGKDAKGGPVEVSYRLVSAGNSVMETLNMPGHKEDMITMYHQDGDNLMMTHYCSMGNQPRMRAAGGDHPDAIDFKFVDGTNMSPEDPHMHELLITFKDKNHITESWTMRAKGEDSPPFVFTLQRAK